MIETPDRPSPVRVSPVIAEFASPLRIVLNQEPTPQTRQFIVDHRLEPILAGIQLSSLHWYPYHDLDHHLDVERRALHLLKLIQRYAPQLVKPSDERIVIVTGQGHDYRMKYSLGMDKEMLSLLQISGVSERETAEAIEGYMRNINKSLMAGKPVDGFTEVFTEDDIHVARSCAIATIPSFVDGRVVQEHLKPDSPLPAVVVALSDLGVPIEGVEAFKRSSDNLMRERFIGIELLLMRATSGEKLTDEEEDLITDVILGWTRSQHGFLEGRIAQLHDDVDAIHDDVAREAILARMQKGHREAEVYMSRVILPHREDLARKRRDGGFNALLEHCSYPRRLHQQHLFK